MTSVSGSGERILAILDRFTEAQPEWTSEALMVELGYSRPTLYRYLKTLKDAGYLVSLPNAGFRLGPRVTELDFLMSRSDPLIRIGQHRLEALAAEYPCAAFIVRWYRRKILCIASSQSDMGPPSSYPRGRPMPLARGAISRAILAFLPRREQVPIIEDLLGEFAKIGIGSSVDEVIDELRAIRRNGYATASGEVTPGVVGIAAPILVAERAPVAALCMTMKACDAEDSGARARIESEILRLSQEISADLCCEMMRQPPQTAVDVISGK